MHSDSDSPMKNSKRKTRSLVVSSSSDEDSDIPGRKRRTRPRVSSSSDDSDESSIVVRSHKKLRRVSSSSDDSDERSFVGSSHKKLGRVLSESESIDSSSNSSSSSEEDDIQCYVSKNRKSKLMGLRIDSESSDGGNDDFTKDKSNGRTAESGGSQSSDEESEKCIICFKAFRGVIAHPSGCSHNFHSECLLQWSKTSNTCPIDRVKYTQVIVTGSEGNVVTRHEVSTPTPDTDLNDIEPDDPTFCEVCSQHDRENEMLLCDRCEAGYHMDCLTPPLFDVPLGDWFCPSCTANDNVGEIDPDEINELLRDNTVLENRLRSRPPLLTSHRIGPRTRAAQRVLTTIRRMAEEHERFQPSSSTSSRLTSRRRRKKSHRRRSTRYEVNLVTVEGTTIEVKVAVNAGRRQKKKKRKSNASSRGRGRVCSSKKNSSSTGLATDGQLSGNHNNLRQPLDIFGSRPQLEYFSGWEAEDELDEDGGLAVLRPRNVGVRGMANRKQMAAQILRSAPRRPTPRINVSSAPPDLLSSILDEQAKWHSPNAVIKSNSNGEVKVILPNKEKNLPVKKTVGSGEASTSSEGKSSSSPSTSTSTSHKESGGGQRNGEASSSVPPLQPPPQPNFSRVYEDEDFDLYADIEPPYVKSMKSYNKKHLAPPPEPPALLLALDGDEGASSPEDAMLVMDDRQTYDPDVPTSPPPSPGQEQSVADKSEKEPNKKVAGNKGIDVPPVDLSTIRLPSPEPDIDDCPNRVMYSEASVNIARQTKSDSESDKEIDIDNPINLVSRLSIAAAPTSDSGLKFSGNNADDKNITNEEKKNEMLSGEECEDNKLVQKADDKGDVSEDLVVENNTEGTTEKYDPEVSDVEAEESTKGKENETKEDSIKEEEIKNENENCDNKDIKDGLEDIVKKDENMESNEREDSKLEEGEIKVEDEEEEKLPLCTEECDEGNDDKKTRLKDEDGVSKVLDGSTVNELEEEKQKSKEKGPEIDESDDKRKERDSSLDSTPQRKTTSEKEVDQEGEDVLELGCGDDERDGLVDITDEEISTYEKSWELEDNQASTEKTAGLEGLETEAISDCEYNITEDGQVAPRAPAENGPKEEGEIISDEKKVPVAWKKITKAKERSYREKDTSKDKNKKKEKKPKEKRKELERYDVRKIISDKPKKRKVDEFGRDISPSRSHSLSDSRSRSRSRSIRSIRRSRSKSRSRSRKRRSRDRRSRNRSRGKRSRDRSKRRGAKSRSRSDSRRRRSRSKKARRSRAKSRDKKRRKRDSSISCSSCSCSSCERDRRKNKKLTVIVPNKKLVNSGKEKKKNKYKERDVKRRRVDSPVPSKEVFTSGDNILVSVNFKSSKSGEVGRKEPSKKKKDDEPKKKKDKSSKENQPLRSIVSKSSNQLSQRRNRVNAKNLKPVAIIDLAQSPFREQTLSPKEVIVLTDSDSEDKRKNDENIMPPCQMTGPKTPPEPHIKFNIVSSKPQMLRNMANPLLDSVDQMEGEGEEEDDDDERVEVPHKGPNTPPEPPVPYDPFEPTKSRSPTPLQEMEESRNPPTPPGDKITPPEPPQRPASPPPKPPPETPKTPSPLHSSPPKPTEDNPPEKAPLSPPNNCNDDSMDMGGGDSPYSPGSSDAEDIFEPPLPQITTPATLSKIKSRPGGKHLQKLTPSPLKRKPGNKTSTPLKHSKGSKKEVIGLKLDEDQLKILDDLPNSAVEMQVKDKFLKKLNRQERVVEEVKMVLKPHYAKKHVTKEEYKEILRKSVPKICHSRSGEINPLKIQRLIEAYVKKYRHLRKKRKMANFAAPDSNPLLKPKPKQTMWC